MTNSINDRIEELNTPGPTGPRTPEGKFESSKNAISHGLTAATIDRFPEHIHATYAKFLAEQYEEHQPATTNERDFLEQYAFNRFQISRARAMMSDAWEKLNANPGDGNLEKQYQKLNRHIKALERSAKYALAELRTFVANRIRNNELRLNLPSFVQEDITIPVAYPSHLLLPKNAKQNDIRGAVRLYIEELLTRFPINDICKPEVMEEASKQMEADQAAKRKD
jgi:hypothetical protein